jgi:hypothetical protein
MGREYGVIGFKKHGRHKGGMKVTTKAVLRSDPSAKKPVP